MLNSAINRSVVIRHFPLLANDNGFEITDKSDPNYNCIAWAANLTNIWWEPLPENSRPAYQLDGVKTDWPFNAPYDSKLATYIKIFENLGYQVCANGDFESGYRKVCLYGDKDGVKHAARQLVTGKHQGIWTSKLGKEFRINHSNPTSVNCSTYGEPLQYLKMKWP